MDAINQPLLDVHDLSVAFGSSLAVDHVSFSIRRGECVALVGESGPDNPSRLVDPELSVIPAPRILRPDPLPPRAVDGGGNEIARFAARHLDQLPEPMTSLNPLHTIDRRRRILSLIAASSGRSRGRAR